MSAKFDMLIKGFTESMRNPKKTTSPYDTTAVVRRIDGDTAFVHIAGGVDETPVSKTVDCKEGDTVQIRISGGRAFIVGNATAPPTDDTTAVKASGTATKFITDMVNGIFVHRENDKKNGVRITDVVDIIRDGKKSATYGEETVFYEPKTEKIAAKIGSFGLRIVRGIISLGNKTSANDTTNSGTYIDADGNMATSNIKAHGGEVGGWQIGSSSIYRTDNPSSGGSSTTSVLDRDGVHFQSTISGNVKSSEVTHSGAQFTNSTTNKNTIIDTDYIHSNGGYVYATNGCNPIVAYYDKTLTGLEVPAGQVATYTQSFNNVPNGYTPVGLIAFQINVHNYTCRFTSIDIDVDKSIHFGIYNSSSTNYTDVGAYFQIACIKTDTRS